MTQLSSTFKLTATALAASLMLAACGGGDAEPPPDLIPPTVVITDSVSAAVATGDVTFTFSFSEPVGSSFVASDITVAGGTMGTFAMAADGLSATLVVVPTADSTGTLTVNVASGAFSDTAGNASTVAFSASQDYSTVVAPPPPPPPTGGVVLASFDEVPPLAFEGFNGAESSSIAAGPAGGTGQSAKIVRLGGEVWAGALVNVGSAVPLSATANTVSARVYSDLAGVPMVLKLENAADAGINTGDLQAQQTVVQGWQTLTWVIPAGKIGPTYNRIVMLPNLGTKASDNPGETYYFDDITLVGAEPPPPPPPPADALVLASFDESPPLAFEGFNGAESSSIAAGPAGGSGLTAKIVRLGGEVWAGALVNLGTAIPLTATANTISARVYSDIAGVPMVLKLENGADAGTNTGDLPAREAVVQGWQTLTWVVPAGKIGPTYNRVVMLPNLGTKASADPGETYYFDDIKLIGGVAGGGGGGGGGAFAGIFADNYLGDLFVNSKTAQGGDIGFFFDERLPATKAYDYAGVSGLAQNPGGVPNFYFGFGLNPPAITNAFFGAFVKSPGNGVVDVSGYTNLKLNVWGPDQLFRAGNFPSLTVVLQGPVVNGCGSNSGGSEVETTFATTTQGAASIYTLPLANFTVKFACSGETSAAQVLAAITQLNVLLQGTNIQYVTKDPDNVAFTNGLNVGRINFD